ncbi:MAG: hypothetical protein WA804_15895 [Terriglobales bacterium]
MSHATQHWPFTNHSTEYGANMANLVLAWTPGAVRIELAEGINLNPHEGIGFGEIEGPREEFSARVSYTFKVH